VENDSEGAEVNQGSQVLGHRKMEIAGQGDLMLHVPDGQVSLCMFKFVLHEFQLDCVALRYMVHCTFLQM
jgi:hypothetical protein